jgi:hypothetical protein
VIRDEPGIRAQMGPEDYLTPVGQDGTNDSAHIVDYPRSSGQSRILAIPDDEVTEFYRIPQIKILRVKYRGKIHCVILYSAPLLFLAEPYVICC